MVPTEVEAVSTRDAPGGPGLVMASFFGKGRRTCNSLGAGTTSEAGGPPGANRKPNSEGKVAKHNSVSNSSFPHNLSRGREVKTIPIKLGVYNTRPLGSRVSKRGKTGIRHKSCPTFSSKSIEVLQGNCRSRSHGNPGSKTQKCSSNVKHCFSRFCKHNFSSSKEGRGHTSYHKSKRTESAFGLRTLQNGGHSFTSRPLNSKRFSGENRSQRRLPHCSYLGKSPEISQVSMGARNSGIQFPSIRCLRSSTHLHKTHENSNGASSSSGLQINCLPRRHPINESISRRFEKRSKSDNSYPDKSGFHYKLQEVCIRPLPLPRVSGFSSKFARNDTQSSTTQNQRHKKHLSKMSQSDGRISAPDIRGNRKTFGLSEGHIPGTTTLSFSSNVENKRSHSPAKLRVSRYTGFGIKGRITVVDRKHRALERKNDNSSFPRIHHRVGRERLGLGCSMPRGQNRGSLARSGDFSPHKRKRIVGSISGREIVFERKRKHSCPHKNGQHNNCSTYKETRRNRFQTMRLHHPRSLAMVFRSENFPSSRISTRGRERGCRLGKSSHARQKQLDAGQKYFSVNKRDFRSFECRSVRGSHKQSARRIHELVSRSRCGRNKRVSASLDGGKRIRFSPVLSDRSVHRKTPRREMRNSSSDTGLADPGVVSPSHVHVDSESPVITDNGQSVDVSDRGRSPIGVQRDSHSNRMEAIRGRFEAIGLSENVKNLLFGSFRDGTNRSYESAWNKWVSWCCEREITPISASLSQFLEYLSWMYENKYEYRTINVHRSAISSVLPPLDGAPIGQNFLVSKLMKGIYNKIPPQPRYQNIWDLDKVLSFIDTLDTDDNLSLKLLSKKLAFLLAVVAPKRVSEISRLNTQFMKFTQNGVVFELPGLSKTQKTGKPKQIVYGKNDENNKLCVIHCLKSYISRTQSKRDNSNDGSLLIMIRKPFRPVSPQTISHWIRDIMNLAGIDTSVFKAHSTRAASSSKASNQGVPLEEILLMADWSGQSTFLKFYSKPLAPESSYSRAVLNLCKWL